MLGIYGSIKNRYLFMIVSFLFWFPSFLYVPILSPYIENLNGSYTLIGIILSSYGLTQLLLRLPIGIISDLLKRRKPFIIIGMVASALSCLLFLMTENLWLILIARALAGVSAASWVIFTVVFPTYYAEHEVHKAMGSISFIVVLGQFLGMSFSGVIVDQWGWKAPFMIGVVFSILGAILSLFINEPKGRIDKEPIKLKQLITVVKDPFLLRISFLSVIAHSIIFSTMFGFTSNYALEIGFRAEGLTWVVFAFMIPHAIATLFVGSVLVPRLGKWGSLNLAFLLSAFFTIVIPLVHDKPFFLLLQGLNGFSLGLTYPLLLGMSIQNIEPKKRATAMGAYQALYAFGIFAGPFFAGIFNSMFGLKAGFYFVGTLGVIATGLTFVWRKTTVRDNMKAPDNQNEGEAFKESL